MSANEAQAAPSGDDPRDSLVAVAAHFYARGWMSGTAGNLSLRLDDGSFWITASGKAKGKLRREDFLRLASSGEIVERGRPSDRPSAETSLHRALYALDPQARACFHIHTVAGNVAARLTSSGALPLPPLEMIKGLGIWDEDPRVDLDVFANHADVPRIAAEMQERFRASPPRLPGFLIRDHGLTVWGPSAEAAFHYVELFEYVFQYMAAARAAGL
jgi:methylthioribulose-1-phosphate dehydratase